MSTGLYSVGPLLSGFQVRWDELYNKINDFELCYLILCSKCLYENFSFVYL